MTKKSFKFIAVFFMLLALVGSIWLLYWQGFNFSIAVGVGFIALAGVAVEISVIMLVYLNQALREAKMRHNEQGHDNILTNEELKHAIIKEQVYAFVL